MYFVSYESIRNQQICSIKSTSNSYSLVIASPKWKCIKFTSKHMHLSLWIWSDKTDKLPYVSQLLTFHNISALSTVGVLQ